MSYIVGASYWLGRGRRVATFKGITKGKHNLKLVKKNVK
jgi:hypothetical protein